MHGAREPHPEQLCSQYEQVTRHDCRDNCFASVIQLRFCSNNVPLIVADERQIKNVMREGSTGIERLEWANYGGRVTAHEALKGYTAIRHFAVDPACGSPEEMVARISS